MLWWEVKYRTFDTELSTGHPRTEPHRDRRVIAKDQP
jgi:hypothetical protein